MEPKAPQERQIADAEHEIAHQTIELLKSYPEADEGVYLSALGVRLAKEFGRIKERTGNRKTLRQILIEQYPNDVKFSGTGNSLRVQLVGADLRDLQPSTIRFDKGFWAAFAKPIPSERRRFIDIESPYNFYDLKETEEPPLNHSGRYEIEPNRIPDPDLPLPARADQIYKSILDWCDKHSLNAVNFQRKNPPKPLSLSANARGSGFMNVDDKGVTVVSNGRPLGVTSLLKMIEAVPQSERKNHSLTLDLIYQLIAR